MAGTTPACQPCAECVGVATRPRPFVPSVKPSAPRATTPPRPSRSSSRSCAATSTSPRTVAWPCSIPSSSSSTAGPPTRTATRSSTGSSCPTIPVTSRLALARFRSPEPCGSSRTTSGRTRHASTSGCRPAGRCDCAVPTWSPPPTSSRTSRAMSSRCTPPTTPTPAAAMHRTAAR